MFDSIRSRFSLASVFRETVKVSSSDGTSAPAPPVSSVPPANPNPLRLPMFKGSYTTAVFVTTGSALDDAISRQNTMRSTSDRPTDSSLESTASTAVAAAGGSMTSRLFDVLLEDHREAPVDIVAEPGKFDSVSSLIRSTTVPMSSTPVYVCCLDSSSPGGGAATGAQSEEAELHRRSNAYYLLKRAQEASVASARAGKAWLPSAATLYPLAEASGLYLPQVSVLRQGAPAEYAFCRVPTQISVICTPSPTDVEAAPSKLNAARMRLAPPSRNLLMRIIWTQLRIARDFRHPVVVLCPLGSESKSVIPAEHMAELYQELLTDFFQGVFQEVRFVIPASLPGVLGAFQAAFGVRGSPSRAQPFSVMGASITSVNSSTSKFSFSRTKQTDSF